MGIYEQYFNVEFGDIGEENKLSSKGFLRLMQETAIIASDKVGYSVNTVSKTNLVWILLNWKLEIFDTPKWNSKILVRTWPRIIDKFYSYREFEMYDDNNKLIAIASSKWLLFNIQTQNIQKASPEMINSYQCIDKAVFPQDTIDKLKEPSTFESSFPYAVQRRDIDTNHHVNNLCYLDFAYQALPEEIFKNKTFNHIEIMYKKSAILGEDIVFLYSPISNSEYIVTIKSKDLKNLHAIIKLSE